MKKFQTILTTLMAGLAVCQASRPSEDFVCAAPGKYADDSDCNKYFICRSGKNGALSRFDYECPAGTTFDARNRYCSTNARCETYDYQSDSYSSESDFDYDEFDCKHAGVHDHVQDPTCSKYFECKQTHRGLLYAVQYTCPSPSKFDPHAGHCSHHYVCPRQFQCRRPGRFEDGTDDFFKRYFLCAKKKTGEMVRAMYTCPLGTRFDSEYEMCVKSDNSAADDGHDHTLPVEDWDSMDTFVCKQLGWFPRTTDVTCKTFYDCAATAEKNIGKHLVSCPHGYLFNKHLALCDNKYICVN